MISAVQVGTETGVVTAAISHAEDRSSHMKEVVRKGGGCVRIECRIAPSTNQVVLMMLCVKKEEVDAKLETGSLDCEVAMILLAMEVWREAKVPFPSPSLLPPFFSPFEGECGKWRSGEFPLFPHQEGSIQWMREMEKRVPCSIHYAGNIRVTDEWFVDTESQSFTTDPSWREAQLVGGVCNDGTGTGKTATSLYHLFFSPKVVGNGSDNRSCYEAKGSLVVLPLNLVSQWKDEISKFLVPDHGFKVIWVVQGRDLKTLTMSSLLEADVVFTTFHFMRTCKPYNDLLEKSLGRGTKTKGSLTSWARTRGREDPVLEGVTWNRILVDEIHDVFNSSRDLRHLKLLSSRMLWGLTATLDFETENAQHVYTFLKREKAHHPNLLSRLLSESVRGTSASIANPTPSLRLVELEGEERARFDALASSCLSVEEVVKLCTHYDEEEGGPSESAEEIERRILEEREKEVVTIRARAEGHLKAVQIYERANAELEEELSLLSDRCAMGDEIAAAQAEAAKEASDTHAKNLERAKRCLDSETEKLKRKEASLSLVSHQLKSLRERSETCSICMERKCVVITPCLHLFCATCVKKHVASVSSTCPTCRSHLAINDLSSVSPPASAPKTKLDQIGDLILSLINEPLILFLQWKVMARGMRAYLKERGVTVHFLEGSLSRRESTLSDFRKGGVLLLCIDDSFAGLHLPHARHVIFAHAIVGRRETVSAIERQAVARCVRHGQTGEVRVYSFVVAESEEEVIWRQTHDMMEEG